jgi:hypothetical protein
LLTLQRGSLAHRAAKFLDGFVGGVRLSIRNRRNEREVSARGRH